MHGAGRVNGPKLKTLDQNPKSNLQVKTPSQNFKWKLQFKTPSQTSD